MVSARIIVSAACLLLLQVCRIQSQAISSEAYSSTSVSNPSQCGGQFIIPAIIKPVLQPEPPCAAPMPFMPDFSGVGAYGGYGGCAYPPIIIEEGSSGKNDLLLPLLIIFALRNGGSGCGQCGNGGGGFSGCGAGFGGYNYPGPVVGCGGFGGYGYGCGCGNNGCGGYNYPSYNSCGCDNSCGCGYDCSNGCPTLNIVVTSPESSTSNGKSD